MVNLSSKTKILTLTLAFSTFTVAGQLAGAETCVATRAAIPVAGNPGAEDAPPALNPAFSKPTDAVLVSTAKPAVEEKSPPTHPFVSQEISLDKTFIQDGETERAQYFVSESESKNIFISASIDSATGDVTLILRDPKTGIASSASGAFGSNGVFTTNLVTMSGAEQQLITLTCQK